MKWCICNKFSAVLDAPIVVVDGEKRIYMSTHKYMVVEPAPLSYLFDEIDKTLRSYETLLNTNPDNKVARDKLKCRWITCKNRVRQQITSSDSEAAKRLQEQQALFREIDSAWKHVSICG